MGSSEYHYKSGDTSCDSKRNQQIQTKYEHKRIILIQINNNKYAKYQTLKKRLRTTR